MRILHFYILAMTQVACLVFNNTCIAQIDNFEDLVSRMKSQRDLIRSFNVAFSQELTDKAQDARSVIQGEMIVDKDAQVLYMNHMKSQLDSPLLREGHSPSRIDRLNNKRLHVLQCPSGVVNMFESDSPVLVEGDGAGPRSDRAPAFFDILSLGLAVHGDMNAKFNHDVVLANLVGWNQPALRSENGFLHCDFGVLKYVIDPEKDYWPVAHEYAMNVKDGNSLRRKLLSRCEISLIKIDGKWLPQIVLLETERTVTEIALKWNSVNMDLDSRFTEVHAFAESTGRPLVTVDREGFQRPTAP